MKTNLRTMSSHIREIGGSHTMFHLPMSLWDCKNYKIVGSPQYLGGLVLLGPYNNDKIILHPGWLRKGVYLR